MIKLLNRRCRPRGRRTGAKWLAVAGAASLLIASGADVSQATPSSPTEAGQLVSGLPKLPATRNPATWPFSRNSPWNTPSGYDVRYSSNSLCTQDVRGKNAPGGTDVNVDQWSVPIDTQTNATRHITIFDQASRRDYSSHLNPGAKPAGPSIQKGGDDEMAIINTSLDIVDETYHTKVYDPKALVTAANFARYSLKGSGIGKPVAGDTEGIRAYGGPAIAGLIRDGELQRGIFHALAFAEDNSAQYPGTRGHHGWVWPAISEDYGAPGYSGHVPMGQLVFIPTDNFSHLGLSRYGKMVAEALHYYGAYNVDSGSGWGLYAEPNLGKEISASSLDTLAYKALPILRKLLVCVTNNTKHS